MMKERAGISASEEAVRLISDKISGVYYLWQEKVPVEWTFGIIWTIS